MPAGAHSRMLRYTAPIVFVARQNVVEEDHAARTDWRRTPSIQIGIENREKPFFGHSRLRAVV